MRLHSGYYFDRWRLNMILSAGGIAPESLLDKVAAGEQSPPESNA
jgi:hypothetical protein